MRVARPADMTVAEDDDLGLEENLANLQNMFGGPMIEVSSSWPRGNRDGILSPARIMRTIGWATSNRNHVERLEVKILEEAEPIDVFSEQIRVEETLNLDSIDVDQNYRTRDAFLTRGFEQLMPEITRMYGG